MNKCEFLIDYYFVGGMPEAVNTWFGNENIIDKVENVTQVHKDLISGYERDFGKYDCRNYDFVH